MKTTIKKHYFKKLKPGKTLCRIPTRLDSMLCGTYLAEQDKTGLITLTYLDGSRESIESTIDIRDFESFFKIVSFVQSGRTKTG